MLRITKLKNMPLEVYFLAWLASSEACRNALATPKACLVSRLAVVISITSSMFFCKSGA